MYVWFKGRNKKWRKVGERSVIVLKISSKPRHLEVRLIYSLLYNNICVKFV